MRKLLYILVLQFWVFSLKAQNNLKKIKEDTTIYTAVEVQPEFPGGEAAMAKFLQKKIHIPDSHKDSFPGKMIMNWIVEKNGRITHIDVSSEGSSVFKRNIVQILKAMPKWSPGLIKSKPVRVKFTCPLTICLGDF